MSSTYIAFRSSERLHENTDGFIKRMNDGATRPEPSTVESIMNDFLDEALEAFFIQPQDFLGLSTGMRRVVNMAADTISKASHMVVKRTAKKLDLQQNREAARYMDSMRIQAKGADGELAWYVSFPIDERMVAEARDAIDKARGGENQAARDAMDRFLMKLADVGLHWYFEEPMKLMGFGPIMQKVVNVGVETTRKATKSVIKKVFGKLDADQLKAAADYIESLMIRVDQKNPEG